MKLFYYNEHNNGTTWKLTYMDILFFLTLVNKLTLPWISPKR